MARKCIECGVKEGDRMQLGDNNRWVTVKLATSHYGPLCQRHIRNAYARTGAAKKRKSKREEQAQRAREEFGQMGMFDDLTNKNAAK